MTSAVLIAAAAAAAIGVAAPPADKEPPGPIDPVALAGRYQLALTWSGCHPPGHKTAEVDLAPIDGRWELGLGPARDGLPTVVVAGDRESLTGTSADVDVALRWRPGRKAPAITITLTSGCTARGTARRIESRVAACDELAALARIEVGCGAVAADARIEDVAAIDAERAAWQATTGKRRRAVAKACETRVAALRPALVDAACLAVPVEDEVTLIDECRDLAARVDKLSRCRMLGPDARGRLAELLAQVPVHVATGAPDQVVVTRQICIRQDEAVRELARAVGCE